MKKYVLILLQISLLLISGKIMSQTGGSSSPTSSVPLLSPNGMYDIVYDRLGNQFSLANLSIGSKPTGGPNSANTATATCVAGKFTLHFEQGSIFDNSVSMQTITCLVYTHISNFINSTISNGAIHIHCSDAAGSLGLASPFYVFPISPMNPNAGIVDGQVYKALVSGTDPYLNLPLSFYNSGVYYHGYIQANPTAVWNYSLNTTTLNSGEYDAYGTMLHEAMHSLGIHTAITNTNGLSMFNSALAVALNSPNNNYYTRYDQFLCDYNGNPLLAPSSASCPVSSLTFAPVSSSVIAVYQATNPGGTQDITTCSTAVQYSGSTNFSVYTPNYLEPGSSLAHFEDMCSNPGGTTTCTGPTGDWNNLYFLMANFTPTGSCYVKRYPKDEERKVLCDLGYSVNATFGSTAVAGSSYSYSSGLCSPTLSVYGNNDGLAGNVYTLVTTLGSLAVPYSSILANDLPVSGLTVSCMELVYNNATFTMGTSDFTVQAPPGSGIVTLKYYPKDIASGKFGNATYISVYFTPPGCNSCGIVNNGGFEFSQVTSNTPPCGILGAPARWLDCWEPYQSGIVLCATSCSNSGGYQLGSSQFFISPPVNTLNLGAISNTQCISLADDGYGFIGAVKNKLNIPLVQGQTYQASFWVINHSAYTVPFVGGQSFNPLNNPVVLTLASNPIYAVTPTVNFPTGLNTLTQFTVNAGNVWTQVTHTFVYTPAAPAVAVILGIDSYQTISPTTFTPSGSYYYCFIDEFSIIPIPGPSITISTSSVCIGQSVLNLTASTTGTFSGLGVTYSGTQYDFNVTGTLTPGVYPIAFTYSNVTCLSTIYQAITVTTCCMANIGSTFVGSTLGTNTNFSGGNLILNSFTVQPGVSLSLTDDIVMSNSVQITISYGASVSIQDAHLHTCGNYLWQGFNVQDGGYLSATNTGNGDNLIEDAFMAIDVANQATNTASSVLDINHTTFNKNYIDINITGYTQTLTTYPFSINNCVFTCRDLLYTSTIWPQTSSSSTVNNASAQLRTAINATTGLAPPYLQQDGFSITTLKGSYSNQPSHIAIQINSVGVNSGTTMYAIGIGDGGNASSFNLFDAHGSFIVAKQSNVKLINNVFQNTQTYTVASGTTVSNYGGSAVTHSVSNALNTVLTVSGTSTSLSNRFWDCHKAIDAKNVYRFDMEYCMIRSTQNYSTASSGSVLPGNTGVNIGTNRFDYYMAFNEFTNVKTGVNIPITVGSYTPYCFVCSGIGIYANRVRIDNNTFGTGTVTNTYMDKAINLTGFSNSPWTVPPSSVTPFTQGLIVTNNTLTNVFRGLNINGVTGVQVDVEANVFSLKDEVSTPTVQYAVNLVNAQPASSTSVGKNIVTSNTASFSSSPSNTLGGLIFCGQNGISLWSPSVTCNNLQQGAEGFVFNGTNNHAVWAGNVMTTPFNHGLVLTNTAVIGVQGGSTTACSDQWVGGASTWTGGNFGTYVGSGSDGLNSQLYVQTGDYYPPNNTSGPAAGQIYGLTNTTHTVSAAGYNCSEFPNNKTISLPRESDYANADLYYMDKTFLYRFLHFNDSVRTNNSEMGGFYSGISGSTIDKFMQIEDYLYEGYTSEAATIISGMDASGFNTIEYNYKAFYNLYIKYLNGSFTASDGTTLYNLALLCPGDNGTSVYQAIALYNTIYNQVLFSDCSGSEGARKVNIQQTLPTSENIWDVDLFPNPATDQLTIVSKNENDVLRVVIKDLSNRLIETHNLKTSNFIVKLDLSLMNGVYLITVTNSNRQKTTKKLIIAK